jgi:hypothetical protein
VRTKQVWSSRLVRWNSLIAALGSSSRTVLVAGVMVSLARLASFSTRSRTGLSRVSPERLIAAV